jgi:hypothetical protein
MNKTRNIGTNEQTGIHTTILSNDRVFSTLNLCHGDLYRRCTPFPSIICIIRFKIFFNLFQELVAVAVVIVRRSYCNMSSIVFIRFLCISSPTAARGMTQQETSSEQMPPTLSTFTTIDEKRYGG